MNNNDIKTQDGHRVLTYSLLIAVIVVWALAWPVSKIGLIDMSPIWYSALRLWIGFATVFIILLFQKKITIPKPRDLPLILSIGILQMAAFLVFINGGLLFVDAGRSAILVYSTPFLVTPIAIIFFREKLSRMRVLGLIFGLIGLLVLFNPWSFDWHNTQVIAGNVLLLLAAVCWAIAMLHTRYGAWHSPPLYLIPWQLLVASLVVMITAVMTQPHPVINWTNSLVLTSLYNGILATGFAYAAIIYVSRALPVISTSLLLLAVPVLGLLFSSLWLGEKLTIHILIAMLLIISGLVFISLEERAIE